MKGRYLIRAMAIGCVAACYGPSAYLSDLAVVSCHLYADCGALASLGVDSEADCVLLLDDAGFECTHYNRQAARDCVDFIEASTCETFEAGQSSEACASVCASALQDSGE